MSRLLRLSPLLVLLTCSPAEEGVLPVRVRRDPGPIAVSATVANGDMPGARMGTTVVVCDGEGMASGVTGQVWGEFSLFGQPNAPQASVLSCRDTGTHEYLAGGSNGLSSIIPPASSWDTFIDAGVQSIDRRPSDTTLLIARGLNVDVFGSTTGGLLGYRAKAVRWGPGGRSFAVVTDNEVKLYAFTPGMLMVPVMGVFIPPQNRTFDDGVTIGEFNLRSGLEVAVTLSQGGVAVYNQSFNTPLYVIAEGSSVATNENWLGSLDSLLVGEPQNELVRRWVGDAAVEDWYLDGGGQTEFGLRHRHSRDERRQVLRSAGAQRRPRRGVFDRHAVADPARRRAGVRRSAAVLPTHGNPWAMHRRRVSRWRRLRRDHERVPDGDELYLELRYVCAERRRRR